MRTLLTAILFPLLLVPPATADTVRLSAAASMTDAIRTLTTSYQQRHPRITFQTNFAASGTLAKQIALGAPADLFISANPRWMDYLVAEQRVATQTVHILATNTLVFVGQPNPEIATLSDLGKLKRIAIGSPKSVPAGQYAEQALAAAGLLERLQGKLVLAKDARQALIYADRGETDGAFVYRTDALLAQHAVILLTVPPSLHEEIHYPIGLTTEGETNHDAVDFFDFLKSETARTILEEYGFTVH